MCRSISRLWNALPPLVRAAAGAALLLLLLASVLKVLGASWRDVAFATVPLAGALIFMAIEPRLQGLTRAKPKLTLAIGGAEDGRLLAVGLAPWPLDVERIVENEAAEALSTIRDGEWPIPALALDLFSRPTPEDHQRAKEQFSSEVATYKEELRGWLVEYSQAALACWGTFEIAVMLTNAPRAFHAEDVEVVLELPDSVTRGSATCPPVAAPPKRPTYAPPRPQRRDPFGRMHEIPNVALHPVSWRRNLEDLISTAARSSRTWDVSTDGRRLVAPKADVQPGRTIQIAEPLSLRADAPGEHEVRWTIYSRSLAEPMSGSILLIVPEADSDRPPFGRLDGIFRYPDAPITDDDDVEERGDDAEPKPIRQIRDSDPPLHPPAATQARDDGVLATLQAAARRWEWEALGLDPALDGPSSNRVRVEPARQVRP